MKLNYGFYIWLTLQSINLLIYDIFWYKVHPLIVFFPTIIILIMLIFLFIFVGKIEILERDEK